MKQIVIFASGSGSNAERIIRHFNSSELARVVLVLSNNRHAKIHDRCKTLGVSCITFNKTAFYTDAYVLNLLQLTKPDIIVLAGFLLRFPESILKHFPNRVINIHPALLPKYGGKGMYGKHVHEAVIKNKETESGITIHYVNKYYDEGAIIFQAKCDVYSTDTAESLAEKIHALEYLHFPKVIEDIL